MNGSSAKIQGAQTPSFPKMEETRFKVVHGCFCGLFFKFAMNASFEMTINSLLATNMCQKITFVALHKYESFGDTTGYVTVRAS